MRSGSRSIGTAQAGAVSGVQLVAAARTAVAVALDEFLAAVEVAAPEVVFGELARDGRQPGKRSGGALVGLEAAGEDGGEVAGAVATDEHRLVTQHLVRIDAVEDEPLQLRVERWPCRAVGDAGDGGIGARLDLGEAVGSEDAIRQRRRARRGIRRTPCQQQDGVAFFAARAGGGDGGVVALRPRGSEPRSRSVAGWRPRPGLASSPLTLTSR